MGEKTMKKASAGVGENRRARAFHRWNRWEKKLGKIKSSVKRGITEQSFTNITTTRGFKSGANLPKTHDS